MQLPDNGGKARKDTTPALPDAALVNYQVMQTVFVNGRIEQPLADDGSDNFVRAAPGLEGPALKLVAEPAPAAKPKISLPRTPPE